MKLPDLQQKKMGLPDYYGQPRDIEHELSEARKLIDSANPEAWHHVYKKRYDFFKAVAQRVPFHKPIKLLDVGCNFGCLTHVFDALANEGLIPGFSYHGVDMYPHVLEAAQKRFPQHQFSVADIYSLEETLGGDTYDCVIASGVFNIIHHWSGALEQLSKVSKGLVCVTHLYVHLNLMYAYPRRWSFGVTPFYLFHLGQVLDLIAPFRGHYLMNHFYESNPEPTPEGLIVPDRPNVVQLHLMLQK